MNENTTTSAGKLDGIELVYPGTLGMLDELEMLDESKHYNSVDLVREINRLRNEINKLKK